MIITLSTPFGREYGAAVRDDSLDCLTLRRDREDKAIQCRIKVDQRRGHFIGVLDLVNQVHGRGSDIAYRQSQASAELALDIEVPLHPVGATGIEFNVGGEERAGGEQLEDLVRKAGGRRTVQDSILKEGSGPRHPVVEKKRQGDDIEDPESAPHRGLAVLKRIPGKPTTL